MRIANEIPEVVYAIFRVSSIRTNPSCEIYVDPHHLISDGRLSIVSDVEIVPKA